MIVDEEAGRGQAVGKRQAISGEKMKGKRKCQHGDDEGGADKGRWSQEGRSSPGGGWGRSKGRGGGSDAGVGRGVLLWWSLTVGRRKTWSRSWKVFNMAKCEHAMVL